MARPGYFFIDSNGVIRENSSKRSTASAYRERVLSKLFPELGEEVTANVEARTAAHRWAIGSRRRSRELITLTPTCGSRRIPCVRAGDSGL